jgi:DNA-binding NarL/FixJ family response regulator
LSRPLQDLGGPLVPAVLARLRQAPAEPAVVSHGSAAGRFVATGRLLQPVAGLAAPAGPSLVQLSLQRHEPHRVALERALRSLPITPGQVAVCRALYQGQAQARISQTLGVAPSTVVDHVRKAYRALDLHSVLDLRALLDARMVRAAAA